MKSQNIFFVKFLLILVSILCFIQPVRARENVSDWYIKDYEVKVIVNEDATLLISEWITADCGLAVGKHGIFRHLPLAYYIGNQEVETKIDNIVVTDFNNKSYNYKKTQQGNNLELKIGDANITVQGENDYFISYRVHNAIRYDENNIPELYWNVLGPSWELEIDSFKAQIVFPQGFKYQAEEIFYYDGLVGEKNIGLFSSQWIDDRTWQFHNLATIKAGQGLTISATLAPELVVKNEANVNNGVINKENFNKENLQSVITDALTLLLINILIIIIAFIMLFRFWKKHGQDPKGRETVVAEFEAPNNLGPLAMSGIVASGGISNRAITATIIKLAVDGYLKIEANKSNFKFGGINYKFIRTDKMPGDDLTRAEKYFLNKLLLGNKEVDLSALDNKLSPHIKHVKKLVLEELDAKKLVYKKSYRASMIMIFIGAMILFLLTIYSFFFFSLPIVAIMLIIFGALMPKRSIEGLELYRHILGFKLYLTTTEKYRSQFYEKENMLEKLLPYAILFGLTKKWLRSMQHIYGSDYSEHYQPSFLSGTANIVGLSHLASSLNSLSMSFSAKSYNSSSGRGGGGFSGGGGGGGGGGGW